GWKVRSNESGVITMDIGDWGGARIRGGYVAPPGGRGGRGGGGRGGGGRGGAASDSGGGRGGRAGADTTNAGRGGAANPSRLPVCETPRAEGVAGGGAVWDGFCW